MIIFYFFNLKSIPKLKSMYILFITILFTCQRATKLFLFGNSSRNFSKSLILNDIKAWVIFGKKHQKKHLCRHDKNYCYFCISSILVIDLIVGSRNMIKVSKNKKSKNRQFRLKLSVFLKFIDKVQQLVQKPSQKNN